VAARLIKTLVENMDCERVLVELSDKILPVAAKLLTDSSQQVRYVCTVQSVTEITVSWPCSLLLSFAISKSSMLQWMLISDTVDSQSSTC